MDAFPASIFPSSTLRILYTVDHPPWPKTLPRRYLSEAKVRLCTSECISSFSFHVSKVSRLVSGFVPCENHVPSGGLLLPMIRRLSDNFALQDEFTQKQVREENERIWDVSKIKKKGETTLKEDAGQALPMLHDVMDWWNASKRMRLKEK